MHKKAIFIFRRDLRLHDNTALIQALNNAKMVIPCFVFDPRQIGKENAYASNNCIQFMIESLQDLEIQLHKKKAKLYLFYGESEKIIEKIIKQEKADAVYVNRDYTPFSIQRDAALEKIAEKNNAIFFSCDDLLLNKPENIATTTGKPYSVFTAFYKRSKQEPIFKPIDCVHKNFYSDPIKGEESDKIFKKILKSENKLIHVRGGRANALNLLKNLKSLNDYKKTRDYPAMRTSNLSAHHKFGTISIRESFFAIRQTLGNNHLLLQQLYWRDFFTYVAFYSPFVFGLPFHEKYTKLPWNKSTKDFKAWCEGKTGFPIVDAGMRQLNETGYMHNRVRMIVASFLTKDLHINWLWGEKYFAQQLVDYDPCVNNGNWQWAASTGCDAQPYFRIFNPWLQQKKFDNECEYIKRWVPELKTTDPKIIHTWYKQNSPAIKNYPRPMVDHKIESKKAKEAYKKASRG